MAECRLRRNKVRLFCTREMDPCAPTSERSAPCQPELCNSICRLTGYPVVGKVPLTVIDMSCLTEWEVAMSRYVWRGAKIYVARFLSLGVVGLGFRRYRIIGSIDDRRRSGRTLFHLHNAAVAIHSLNGLRKSHVDRVV